jgi:NTP pyrophosphatase (non-canonical NTP hydrolase)
MLTTSDMNYESFNQYQLRAGMTAIYPNRGDNLYYPALGLAGEAGEVCEKIKKVMRDKDGKLNSEDRTMLIKELGDVLWYVSAIADELDAFLGDIALVNIEKLRSRQERNKISGSGDSR